MRGIPVKYYKFYLTDEEGNSFCDHITIREDMEKESIVDFISHYVFCTMRRKLLPEKDWKEAVYQSTLYRAGVKDTWKTVKSLYKLSPDDIKSIFSKELWVEDILNLYNYDTVRNKLNQHEEELLKQDAISRKAVLEQFNAICESCGKYKEYNGTMCGTCYLDDAISIVEGSLPITKDDNKQESDQN